MITTEYEDNTLDIEDLSQSHEQPLEIKTTLLKTDIPRRIGNRIIEDSIIN